MRLSIVYIGVSSCIIMNVMVYLLLVIAKVRIKFSINADGYRCLTKSCIEFTRVLKTSLVSYVDKGID